jgi:hypothetical protein
MNRPRYKESLDQVTTKVFEDLVNIGYRYKGVSRISNNELIGTYFVATLSSASFSRAIEIALIPQDSNKFTKDVVTIHIDNLHNDTFSISNFCRYKNLESIESDLTMYPGSFPSQLQSCLQEFHEVLINNLSEIIEGKKWEHVPFDWGEYK